MTVQELIDELSAVEDKARTVVTRDGNVYGYYFHIDNVRTDHDRYDEDGERVVVLYSGYNIQRSGE